MEVKRRTARALVQRLSGAADAEAAFEAVAEIRLLSKHDAEARTPLADAGAVPLLACHLQLDQPTATPDSQENAAAALLNLSISAPESLMSQPGLLDALAHAICPASSTSSSFPVVAQHAAATLYSLLSVDAYRPIIGSKRTLVSALVGLIRAPNAPTRSIKDGLKALFGIALYPLNRGGMVDLGAVPALFSLVVKDGPKGVVEDATAVLAQVAGCAESVDAFRRVAGVRVLVDLVDLGTGASQRASENAVSALLNLALCCGERALGDIREMEHAVAAVAELAESGSARAKNKASALVALLLSSRRNHHHNGVCNDFQPPSSPPLSACPSADAF